MLEYEYTQKEGFDLAKDVPFIHNHEELECWLKPLYIIENYLVDHDTYRILMVKIGNILKGCFHIAACRSYPVKFKFYLKDEKVHTIELRHFYINIMLWEPFVEINDVKILNESFILKKEDIPNINDYVNYTIIQSLREEHLETTTFNYQISEVQYNLSTISLDFSQIMNLNFSFNTFLNYYENYPEIRELMDIKFDPDMQPHEIEAKLHDGETKLVKALKMIDNDPIGIILNAKTGMKTKQLVEFTMSEGLNPTLRGETIPIVMENSTLIGGRNKPSTYFIGSISSRKSLVSSKKIMGRAGYFGKTVLILARTLVMSLEESDCNTTHLVKYEIKSPKHLKKLNGKFYKMDKSDIDYQLLNSKTDTHLIGKTIYARSAATCALGDNCVCPRCIGYTANTNMDIADGLGSFESDEQTKVVNQGILSIKHLLTTDSEQIEFNEDFNKFFNYLAGDITPNVNNNEYINNIEDYAVYIDPDDIETVDDMDDDAPYNKFIKNGRFYVRELKDPKNEETGWTIFTKDPKELYITEEASEIMRKNKGLIPFKDLDEDTRLFDITILNRELTKALYDLMDLLNKNSDKYGVKGDIDSISQAYLDILVDAGIGANAVSAEMVLNRLIRSIDRPYDRPDFSHRELEPYGIYTVSKNLEKNRSPFVGLSYQDLKKQLLSDDLFEEKTGTSYLDPFFSIQVPMKNFKKYSNILFAEMSKKDIRKAIYKGANEVIELESVRDLDET